MHKISDVLQDAKIFLRKNNVDEREARLLLSFTLGINSDILIRYNEIDDTALESFNSVLKERVSGKPFAYITGYKEFMNLKFNVNENVLIPRPETEMLVENALKTDSCQVLDMCTGSGCIAISFKYYKPSASVTAVDISDKALEIAKQNALINNVEVNFLNSNLFENVTGRYDLIISNPPYIKTEVIENLQIEVKQEPLIALDGGITGLDFYEKIAKEAKLFLLPKGILMFEIGYDQGKQVSEVMKRNNYKDVQIKKDLSENDRIIIGEIQK